MRPNEYFDRNGDNYADEIMAIQPKFYENTAKLINNATKNSSQVLDIGNGGVINYEFDHFDKLVCGDLFVSQIASKRYEACCNVEFVKADILNLQNFADDSFDTVIISAVIHHLAGSTLKRTHENTCKAISECLRVIKQGGGLLIIESTVSRWFEVVEKLLYPIMQLFFKICKFGNIYQYSVKSLYDRLDRLCCNLTECSRIDIGPYIWIMGKKIPTCLTPCRAVWIRIIKE